METKHTPGPWSVRDRRADSIKTAIEQCAPESDFAFAIDMPHPPFAFGAIGALVCSRDPSADANASLIAAAPDLLEACETFAEWLEREDKGPTYPPGTKRDSPGNEEVWRAWYDRNLELCSLAVKQARAAIAKAEGR